jgi:hypothetical protein
MSWRFATCSSFPRTSASRCFDGEANLVAAAPDRPSEEAVQRCEELAREAMALAPDAQTPVEVDVTVDGGTVFVVREDEPALVCIAGPFALPGLILHDMRVVLGDLRRGEGRSE